MDHVKLANLRKESCHCIVSAVINSTGPIVAPFNHGTWLDVKLTVSNWKMRNGLPLERRNAFHKSYYALEALV